MPKVSRYNTVKSVSELLTHRSLGVLQDSVSHKLLLPGSVEIAKGDIGVRYFMKLSKIPFREMLS